MKIEELRKAIESSGLRPADIVRMTDGDIKLSQASAWLLDMEKMSSSTRHLLIRLCSEKLGSAGIFQQPKVQSKKEPSVAKKEPQPKTVAPDPVMVNATPVVDSNEPPKIPATTQIHRPVRGGQTIFDKPMTYRPRNIGNHYFIAVYLESGWYKVDAGTEKFEIDGVVYSMSDFKLAD